MENFQFIELCSYGHIDPVRAAVANNPNLDVHADRERALKVAAEQGHLDIVKFLIEDCNADVKIDNNNPVYMAIIGGHLDVVKYFIEKQGVNPRYANDAFLSVAVGHRKMNVMKYLVEDCNADINTRKKILLQDAVASDQSDIVTYFLERGMTYDEFSPHKQNVDQIEHGIFMYCEAIREDIEAGKCEQRPNENQKKEQIEAQRQQVLENIKNKANTARPKRRPKF